MIGSWQTMNVMLGQSIPPDPGLTFSSSSSREINHSPKSMVKTGHGFKHGRFVGCIQIVSCTQILSFGERFVGQCRRCLTFHPTDALQGQQNGSGQWIVVNDTGLKLIFICRTGDNSECGRIDNDDLVLGQDVIVHDLFHFGNFFFG